MNEPRKTCMGIGLVGESEIKTNDFNNNYNLARCDNHLECSLYLRCMLNRIEFKCFHDHLIIMCTV